MIMVGRMEGLLFAIENMKDNYLLSVSNPLIFGRLMTTIL